MQNSECSPSGSKTKGSCLHVNWHVDPDEISTEAAISSLNWPVAKDDNPWNAD